MIIKHGNGRTTFGPGVSIDLTGDEVATAIDAWLVAHGVYVDGPRTIRVNGELCASGHVYVRYLERGGAERSDLATIREALRPSAAITDDQIRLLCREDPRLLDTLMIAIHGADRELRDSARTHFAMLQEASGRAT